MSCNTSKRAASLELVRPSNSTSIRMVAVECRCPHLVLGCAVAVGVLKDGDELDVLRVGPTADA